MRVITIVVSHSTEDLWKELKNEGNYKDEDEFLLHLLKLLQTEISKSSTSRERPLLINSASEATCASTELEDIYASTSDDLGLREGGDLEDKVRFLNLVPGYWKVTLFDLNSIDLQARGLAKIDDYTYRVSEPPELASTAASAPTRAANGFSCILCSKRYSTVERLNAHLMLHNKTKQLKCCDIVFPFLCRLRTHQASPSCKSRVRFKNTEPKRLFECRKCKMTFSRNWNLLLHESSGRCGCGTPEVKIKSSPSTCKAKCDSCNFVFSNAANLRRHIKNKSCKSNLGPRSKNPSQLQCRKCSKTFINYWDLLLHKKDKKCQQKQRVFVCPRCSQPYGHRAGLYQHLKRNACVKRKGMIAGAKKVYKCRGCSNVLLSSLTLKSHHFSCIVCLDKGWTLAESFKLVEQKEIFNNLANATVIGLAKVVHNNTVKYKCKQCKELMSDLKTGRDHLGLHFKGDKYGCVVCKRKFLSLNACKRHISVSACKEKSARLSQKYKVFKMQNAEVADAELMREDPAHSASTNSEKVSKMTDCPICGIAYSREFLEVHIKAHSANLEFKCELCGISYPKAGHLNQHKSMKHACKERQNGGANSSLPARIEIPNGGVCPICGVTYDRRFLPNHIRAHSANLEHRCQYCGVSYSLSRLTKKHIIAKHPDRRVLPSAACSSQTSISKPNPIDSESAVDEEESADLETPPESPASSSTADIKPKPGLNEHSGHTPVQLQPRTPTVVQLGFGYRFECTYCRARFQQESVLQGHVQDHHSDELMEANFEVLDNDTSEASEYECTECQQKFDQLASLEAHVMIEHPELVTG